MPRLQGEGEAEEETGMEELVMVVSSHYYSIFLTTPPCLPILIKEDRLRLTPLELDAWILWYGRGLADGI